MHCKDFSYEEKPQIIVLIEERFSQAQVAARMGNFQCDVNKTLTRLRNTRSCSSRRDGLWIMPKNTSINANARLGIIEEKFFTGWTYARRLYLTG